MACPQDPKPYVPRPTDPGVCELVTEACPASPVSPRPIMKPSFRLADEVDKDGKKIYKYASYCEQRFLEHNDPAGYGTCTSTKGFVVMTHELAAEDDAGDPILDENDDPVIWKMCRLLHPATCAIGLHRALSNQCRALVRRTWQCATGIPTNQFNTCYEEPADDAGLQHPACDPRALDFVALDCAEYVGRDYARTPQAIDCTTRFDTGRSRKTLERTNRAGTSSDYWCEFETSLLNVECHGTNPPRDGCAQGTSLCLKRASETGGCNAIAQTILCRALQHEVHADGDLEPSEIDILRNSGCQSCVTLPFEPVPPSCGSAVAGDPHLGGRSGRNAFEALLLAGSSLGFKARNCKRLVTIPRLRVSDYPECLNQPPPDCGGPPRGRVDWSSEHHSQLAVVNSPVILNIIDIPSREYETPYVRGASVIHSAPKLVGYADSRSDSDSLVRLWKPLTSERSYSRVTDYLLPVDGPCLVEHPPRYEAIVEELWPDVPEQKSEIVSLFGSEALDWWDRLSRDERGRRTAQRGFTYWDDLSSDAEREHELENRTTVTREEIRCNVGDVYWCRWLPTRPGFYRAIAGGAWVLVEYSHRQSWARESGSQIVHLDSYLSDLGNKRNTENILSTRGLQPEQAGLDPSLTMRLPQGTDDEWLFTTEAAEQFWPPTTDLRLDQSSSGIVGVYTKTEPIGIQVYEVRVATRAPNP